MKKWQPELVMQRGDHVVWKIIDEKAILLNLESGAYFEVNPVGLKIWQELDGQTSLGKVARSISEAFRVEEKRAAQDLGEFIGELKQRKMVETSKKSAALSS
jgi:hypothetical protein